MQGALSFGSIMRDLSTGINETSVHCLFEEEKASYVAVHVYCTLVVVAHSTGTISVALCNLQ